MRFEIKINIISFIVWYFKVLGKLIRYRRILSHWNHSVSFARNICQGFAFGFDSSKIIMYSFFHVLHFRLYVNPAQNWWDDNGCDPHISDYFWILHNYTLLFTNYNRCGLQSHLILIYYISILVLWRKHSGSILPNLSTVIKPNPSTNTLIKINSTKHNRRLLINSKLEK